MPPQQGNCMYCRKPFQVGWVLNKHHKQCIVLSAETDHGADETLDDHEVRDADEMATEHEQRTRRAVLLEDEDADRSYELHAVDAEGLPETITIKEHKHKWILSPKLIDIIQFLGATSRGLPMPEGNVNTMLHYVKSLQGSAAKNLPKGSKTAWRLLTTARYVRLYIKYTSNVYFMYIIMHRECTFNVPSMYMSYVHLMFITIFIECTLSSIHM